MRCHRIPREYILAPAAKIKVPARMSYGDPVRVPSAMPRACPRASPDDFIVLHTFRSSAFPCGDIGPVCSSSTDSFCFRGNEPWDGFSHPLESWFMDRLGLSFMVRLGTLICIFELKCLRYLARISHGRRVPRKIIMNPSILWNIKNALKAHNMKYLILIFKSWDLEPKCLIIPVYFTYLENLLNFIMS